MNRRSGEEQTRPVPSGTIATLRGRHTSLRAERAIPRTAGYDAGAARPRQARACCRGGIISHTFPVQSARVDCKIPRMRTTYGRGRRVQRGASTRFTQCGT